MRVDGVSISARDVEALRVVESSTGQPMPRTIALVAAIDHASRVAVAKRAGFEMAPGVVQARFKRMKEESQKKMALADAIRRAGEAAYLRWRVEPVVAEDWLAGVWKTTVEADGERRVTDALTAALAAPDTFASIAQKTGGKHVGFSLHLDYPAAHLPTGSRIGYESDLADYNRGERAERPEFPYSDLDVIDGIGLVPKGYIEEVATKIIAPLADGAVWPKPIYDGETWSVVRRRAVRGETYTAEAIRFTRPALAEWINTRRRDLAYEVCDADAVREAVHTTPDHPLWELLK